MRFVVDIQIIDSSDTLFRTQNVYIVIIVFFHNRVENTHIYIVDRSNITQITSKPPKARTNTDTLMLNACLSTYPIYIVQRVVNNPKWCTSVSQSSIMYLTRNPRATDRRILSISLCSRYRVSVRSRQRLAAKWCAHHARMCVHQQELNSCGMVLRRVYGGGGVEAPPICHRACIGGVCGTNKSNHRAPSSLTTTLTRERHGGTKKKQQNNPTNDSTRRRLTRTINIYHIYIYLVCTIWGRDATLCNDDEKCTCEPRQYSERDICVFGFWVWCIYGRHRIIHQECGWRTANMYVLRSLLLGCLRLLNNKTRRRQP